MEWKIESICKNHIAVHTPCDNLLDISKPIKPDTCSGPTRIAPFECSIKINNNVINTQAEITF